MSALGVVPGFSYPALAYQEAEFSETVTAIPAVAGSRNITIAAPPSGFALYVDSVRVVTTADATVGNRFGTLIVQDQDANQLSFITNPLAATASQGVSWQWLATLSNAYSVNNAGFAPLQNVILLPGFKLLLFYNTPGGAVDTIAPAVVTGRRIPTAPARADTPLLPTPLIL